VETTPAIPLRYEAESESRIVSRIASEHVKVDADGHTSKSASRCLGESRAMIHYSCDMCKRPMDPENDLRYVVKLEVYAAFDPLSVDDAEDDRDCLQDLHDILERVDDAADETIGDDVYQQLRFDVCPECRQKLLKNPLGKKAAEKHDFSRN